MKNTAIAIGCDHAGYEYKERIIEFLVEKNIKSLDKGTDSGDSVDYPDFVHPVADAVEARLADLGIIICGSGNGAAMTANKHQGIRAALCWNVELAELARQHNNANIISIPARYVSVEKAIEMVEAFLQTEFEGGRHARRVGKIACS
jgi:ribose 5-phosphate isomerase B